MLTCADFDPPSCCSSCHEDAELYGNEYPFIELTAEQTGRGEPALVCCMVYDDIKFDLASKNG
jgi:hypothetical protein